MKIGLRNVASSLVFVVSVSACGGGDRDLRPDEGTVGFFFTESFRGSRLLSLLAFEGGLVYGFYQADFTAPIYPEYAYAGFFVAQHSPASLARIGSEYNFEDGETSAIQLHLGALSSSNVFGSLKQTSSTEESTFGVRESTNSQLPTNQASLSGAYTVQARSPSASFKTSGAVVTAAGQLSATYATCNLAATLTARPLGNVYDVAATVEPGCSLGVGSFTGHAIQAYATRNLYVLLVGSREQGIMLLLVPDAP